jgi:hypothetical protein
LARQLDDLHTFIGEVSHPKSVFGLDASHGLVQVPCYVCILAGYQG